MIGQAAVLLSAQLWLLTQVQAVNNTTFTPPKLAWTALNSNISARAATGFAAMPDGMIYVVGGGVGGVVDAHRYNPATSTWTALNASGSIPSPRVHFCVAGTPDGMLYLFGGSIIGAGYTKEFYSFNTTSAKWTAITAPGGPGSPRSLLGCTGTPDGMFYVQGGSQADPGIYFKGLFRFNPASGTWALRNSPDTRPGPRHMLGLVATPDGLIYCFAGYAIENFEGVFVHDLNRYNPADDSWTELAPTGVVPQDREWTGFAAGPDGLLYTFGGMGGNRTEQLNSLNDSYVYSPAHGTWAALAPIGSGPSPRYAVSMVAAPDGALYVLGGVTDAGNSVDFYRLAPPVLTTTAPPTTAVPIYGYGQPAAPADPSVILPSKSTGTTVTPGGGCLVVGGLAALLTSSWLASLALNC